MAFTPQNDSGSIDNANAYVSAEEYKEYCADRGVPFSAYTDDQIKAAIVDSTDFLDARFSFIGVQRRVEQGTQFPRWLDGYEYKSERHPASGLPLALKQACFRLTTRSLAGQKLLPDPTFNPGGQVIEKSVKAGPVETSTKFSEPSSGAAAVPSYPDVELLLKNAKLLGSSLSRPIQRG